MVITSRNNPFVRHILSLREKKFRREAGEFVVEGVKQVNEALAGGCGVKAVVCAESFAEAGRFEGAVLVSDGVFEKLSGEVTPQGVLALLAIPELTPRPPQGKALLLDGVSDPGNMGAILRTANAAGYADVYLRGCVDPFSPKSVRAAMSGLFFLRLHAGEDAQLADCLAGVPLLCADMGGEDVFSFSPPPNFCLVIGNEANGVSKEVRARCAHTVRIPMRESCESLNAAVSAGILMYELQYARERKLSHGLKGEDTDVRT